MLSVLTSGCIVGPTSAAFATSCPSYAEVQNARQGEAAKQAEITTLNQLLATLQAAVASTQADAVQKGNSAQAAQQKYDEAAARAVKTVMLAGPYGGYGNYIRIRNDGDGSYETAYGHIVNGGTLVHIGQTVQVGQNIARVGSTGMSTGCHLHFEIHHDGGTQDPVPFMRSMGVDFATDPTVSSGGCPSPVRGTGAFYERLLL